MAQTAYQQTLYAASWRGFPFVVTDLDNDFGRKLADHGYPFRDTSWQEDLGRKPREFEVKGFIEGDDVVAQETYLISLAEMAGPGILIHPTRGILNVTLLGLNTHSVWDNGRHVELTFKFKEAGSNLFPSVLTSGLGAIGDAIDDLFGAGSSDFVSGVTDAVKEGADVVTKAVATVTQFTAAGGALVKGSTNLFSQVSSLAGNFGRFAGGSTGSGTSSVNGPILSTGQISSSVSSLIAQGAAARSAVSSSAGSLLSSVEGL